MYCLALAIATYPNAPSTGQLGVVRPGIAEISPWGPKNGIGGKLTTRGLRLCRRTCCRWRDGVVTRHCRWGIKWSHPSEWHLSWDTHNSFKRGYFVVPSVSRQRVTLGLEVPRIRRRNAAVMRSFRLETVLLRRRPRRLCETQLCKVYSGQKGAHNCPARSLVAPRSCTELPVL